jgi:hypothetical protein
MRVALRHLKIATKSGGRSYWTATDPIRFVSDFGRPLRMHYRAELMAHCSGSSGPSVQGNSRRRFWIRNSPAFWQQPLGKK